MINKVTAGHVVQVFDDDGNLITQKFIDHKVVQCENQDGIEVKPKSEADKFNHPFDMVVPDRSSFNSKNPIKIKKWISDGNAGLSIMGLQDTNDLYEVCGHVLDNTCSWDIMGEVLFEGDDDKVYVLNVEAVISEANEEYVQEVKQIQAY